jgi:UDP-GlcNAc:undecaprenyl-phosphate GlcNAc-1-phosphate transferase
MVTAPAYLLNLCTFGLFFFTALTLSLIFTPASIKLARFFGIIDTPDIRKVHRNPITRMGGLAIACTILLAAVLCTKFTPFVQAYLLGMCTIACIGLIDDKFSIPPIIKLLGEIISSLIFVLLSGDTLSGFGNLLGFGDIPFSFLSLPITIFFMAGVINSFNLSDGLDGLAGGISLIGCLFLLPMLYIAQLWSVLGITVIIMGALLGFLRYNSYPAKLFMGDTGSLILGYSFSCIALDLVQSAPGHDLIAPVTVFIPISFPIVDMVFVICKRIIIKHHIFSPDKLHFHHRLMVIGMPHSLVVTTIYGICFVLGLIGWNSRLQQEWQQFAIVSIFYLFIYSIIFYFEKTGKSFNRRDKKIIKYKITSTKYVIASSVGRLSKYVAPIFLLLLVLPVLFTRSTPGPFALLALTIALLVAVLYPWQGGKRRINHAHALIFIAIFSLLAIYHFNPDAPKWSSIYFAVLTLLAGAWVTIRILLKKRYMVLLPTSIEILLIVISWFIPLVWGGLVGIEPANQDILILVCFQSIPILAAAKTMLRRQAKRNAITTGVLVIALLYLGGRAFL